ncbi:MAG: tetratricopeptide repeat protein [Anaerolineales bacterium]|nr:tetratricopeptide repeat protein [Anaerolineales bacterium]
MEAREWRNAEGVYRQILTESPQNAAALLGLAKSLLLQNNPGEAESILANFPASREYAAAQALLPLTRALLEPRNGNLETDNPLEAAYNQALRLVKRGNLPAALDGLLDILRQDKHYRDGQVRVLILALLELLGEQNPLTRQYRQELASALF